MAKSEISCLDTIFRFTVNAESLRLKSVESPQFKLNDVSWKIKLCKTSAIDDTDKEAISYAKCLFEEDSSSDMIDIHLVSAYEGGTVDWSCEAQAAFKLLHKDDDVGKSTVKYLSKRKFSNAKLSHGIDDFIKFNDFLENYVHENRATFEIEVITNPLSLMKQLEMDQMYGKFRVMIENVSKLESNLSSEVIVRNIKWRIKTKRENDALSVYLLGDENDMDMNWIYKVDVTFNLLSFDRSVKPIKHNLIHEFRCGSSIRGCKKLMEWSKFIDESKQFVSMDIANLFIQLKVDPPQPLWKIDKHNLSNAISLLQCSICFETFSGGKIFATECGHLYCKPCIETSNEDRAECPVCNAAIDLDVLRPIYFG